MSTLVAFYLFAFAFLICGYVFVQALRGRTELFCIRNILLLGFAFFQLIGAALAITFDNYAKFTVSSPGRAGLIFATIATLFVAFFMFFYRSGWVVRSLARHLPVTFAPAGVGTMLILSVGFLIAGLVSRLVLGAVPIVGPIFLYLSMGLLSVAAGMAVWGWIPRFWNLAIAMVAVPVILTALLIAMYGTFGRREILNIILACTWAAFHSWWKYLGMGRALFRVAALSCVGIVFLAAFSATRGEAGEVRTSGQIISDLARAPMDKGMAMIMSPQDSGPISMWVCETRPDSIPYDTLHQARYFLTHGIPRAFWPNKPDGLGRTLVLQRNMSGVGDVFTVGPGLVGHIVNDNPWLSLVLYAAFLGLLLRFFDELLMLHGHNPFLVLPLGVALGEWFAISRGESALFLFMALSSTIGAWIAMAVCAKALSLMGFRLEFVAPEEDPAEAEDGSGEESREIEPAGTPRSLA